MDSASWKDWGPESAPPVDHKLVVYVRIPAFRKEGGSAGRKDSGGIGQVVLAPKSLDLEHGLGFRHQTAPVLKEVIILRSSRRYPCFAKNP